ncbi:MAG: ABC transporter ATP-binding protein [Candidatus Bathyarchaeia archaeon]
MAEVRLENLTKIFGKQVAVDHVNLEVKDGELMSLLGPSGCGKTTTLRMIAGLEVPTEGKVYIGGKDVTDYPPKDRDIGMIFQFYAMYPGMKVFDQLAFPLQMRKVPKSEIKERVFKVAEMLGLTHLLNEQVSSLTVEQRQKIEVGRAIVREPKVYLWDEPLTNLDASVRLFMRAELKRLQKELGTTTIYVTHDQLESMVLADRIAVMDQGRIIQCDPPEELYERPRNLFVAGFIGSPSMNFMKCLLGEEGGKLYLKSNTFKYDVTNVAEELKKCSTDEVVLGVRPEYVNISKAKPPGKAFKGEVTLIEPFGFRMIVHLKLNEETLRANVRATPLTIGEKVWITLTNIHLFDGKTEQLII